MKIDNLVMINIFGEGYYSGNTQSNSMVVEKAFYEEYKEEIDSYTPYFSELDGKHSEVQGNLTVTPITKENLGHVVAIVLEDCYWEVSDILSEISKELPAEWEKQDKVHEDFVNLCKIDTVTKIYFDGKEI